MPKLNNYLATRVSTEIKDAFIKKASKYDDPATVHRELINAFVEDRLTMTPPKDHPLFERSK